MNLMADREQSVGINQLNSIVIASNRTLFKRFVGYGSDILTQDEIDTLRPKIYNHMAKNSKETIFLKVHDAYTFIRNTFPLFPPTAGRKAIYIIRNPLDVAVSFAHHKGDSNPERAIDKMANPEATLSKHDKRPRSQLLQIMLSWSQHVQSWVNAPHMDVLVIRYEDMKSTPADTFKKIALFTCNTSDVKKIDKALRFSSFDRLKKEEESSGFREKPKKCRHFFRKGVAGSWRNELTTKQVTDIIDLHGATMKQFGYLNRNNEPV